MREYQHPKLRKKGVEIALSKSGVHRLPRISQVVQGWIVDEATFEIELVTEEGQQVIVDLDVGAVGTLRELLSQVDEMENEK